MSVRLVQTAADYKREIESYEGQIALLTEQLELRKKNKDSAANIVSTQTHLETLKGNLLAVQEAKKIVDAAIDKLPKAKEPAPPA